MALNDNVRVEHMLSAIDEAVSFAKGKNRQDLNQNRMLVLSIIKEIEIIGEAASKISKSITNRYPEVPWSDIVGMRNKLIHGYFDIDLDILWNTIKRDLPELYSQLQKIIIEK